MKTILAAFVAVALSQLCAHAQAPSTPIPMATPAPGPIAATVTLSQAQWQAALTTAPQTPQSILTLIQSVIQMPAGTDFAHFRSLSFFVMPNGSARVIVQFAAQ